MTTIPPPGDPQGRDDLPDAVSAAESPSLTAPAPPPGVLDAARTAAMAAFDDHHGADGVSAARNDAAGDLAAARARRWYQRVPLGAAAAVIAAIAIVGTLTQLDTGGDDDLATAVAESGGSDAADDFAADDSSGGGDSAGAMEAPEAAFEADSSDSENGARPEDGAATLDATAAYDDLDAFLAVIARQDPTATASSPPQPSTTTRQSSGDDSSGDDTDEAEVRPCDAIAIAGADGVVAVEVAFVEDLGLPVAAVVYESDNGARVTAVDLSACAVLDDRAL